MELGTLDGDVLGDASAATVAPVELEAPEKLELAAVLHALSDPIRLRIVQALAGGAELSCGGFDLPITKSTCSHHFRVLREAGVIRQRVSGKTKLNLLRRDDLDAAFPGLLDAVLRPPAT